MSSLGDWRIATSVLPRRTALRIVGISALGTVLSACGGKGVSNGSASGSASPAAMALGRFAAGTWTVSAPDAHYTSATITISGSGSWKGTFVPTPDQDSEGRSGTWALSGKDLRITVDDHEATASDVPATVLSGNASSQFTWTYDGDEPSDTQARYDAKTKTLTLTRQTGRVTQTITAVRS